MPAPKNPTAKEILTDPKYSEQKSTFKELMKTLAKEIRDESDEGNEDDGETVSVFDSLFGPGKKK